MVHNWVYHVNDPLLTMMIIMTTFCGGWKLRPMPMPLCPCLQVLRTCKSKLEVTGSVMVHPQSVTKKYVGSPNTYPIYPIRMARSPHHWRLWAPEQSMKPELFCPTPKGKWISHPGTTIEMLRTGWDDFSMSYWSSIADLQHVWFWFWVVSVMPYPVQPAQSIPTCSNIS